jgi:hypothetical protein
MPCKPSRPRPMHCWLKRTHIANSPPPLLIRTGRLLSRRETAST